MAHTRTWDAAAEAVPAATADIKDGDDAIRNLKVDIRERMAVDHYMDIAGTDADHGEHQKITFQSQIAKPAAVANKMFVYTKDVAGKVELFIEDEDGHEIQLTSGGAIIAGSATTAVTATNLSGGTVSGTTGAFSGLLESANPLFSAKVTAQVVNCTGVPSIYTAYTLRTSSTPACNWTEISDRANNFANGTFTASKTGLYLLTGTMSLGGFNGNQYWFDTLLITSNRYYRIYSINPSNITIWGYLNFSWSQIVDMEAADTAYLQIMVYDENGPTIDLETSTTFQGYLLP